MYFMLEESKKFLVISLLILWLSASEVLFLFLHNLSIVRLTKSVEMKTSSG